MNKKIHKFTAFLLILSAFLSSYAYAGSSSSLGSTSFDVSIDRVRVNGKVVAESKSNLIEDADVFSVIVDITAVGTLEKGHIEAVLRGRQSGNVVSDSTNLFDLGKNQSASKTLTLALIDSLKRETEFDLAIKVVDARERSEQKVFGLRTKPILKRGVLDVSVDRVKLNSKVIAASKTNFLDKSDIFDVVVEFTALEDLEDAHVEAILKELRSGLVVADASPNFDLNEDLSSSKALRLNLFDRIKRSDSFELTVKIVDADSNAIQKTFGIKTKDKTELGRDLDISIDSIDVEGKAIIENEKNIVVMRDDKKELDVRVRLTALENIEDAHIDAILAFENGEVVADTTTTFDLNKDESAVKKLELPLIIKLKQGNFNLKLRTVDAEGDSEEKNYGLKITQKKFPFIVSSISLSPEENVEAGKSIIATLSLKGTGLVSLDGAKAKVSIPELGISSAKFIEQKNNRQELREDFILKILDETPTGTYTLKTEVTSQFSDETEVKEIPVFVLGKDEQKQLLSEDRLVINVPVAKQNVFEGSEVIYPITLKNEGTSANTYTVLLDGSNWANLRLAGSNVLVIGSKESKTVNIYASSREGVKGEHAFLVTIKSDDKILKQFQLRGNAIPAKSTLAANLKNALEIVLIGFVVFLVLAGLFFGIKRHMENEEESVQEELAEIEPYY